MCSSLEGITETRDELKTERSLSLEEEIAIDHYPS